MPRPPAEESASRATRRSKRFRSDARALGRRIRALRQERGLTLEDLAEAAGVHPSHLWRAEAGTADLNITLVTLVRIAQGLGVPTARLFCEEEG